MRRYLSLHATSDITKEAIGEGIPVGPVAGAARTPSKIVTSEKTTLKNGI
jgi:hypothetical protein